MEFPIIRLKMYFLKIGALCLLAAVSGQAAPTHDRNTSSVSISTFDLVQSSKIAKAKAGALGDPYASKAGLLLHASYNRAMLEG